MIDFVNALKICKDDNFTESIEKFPAVEVIWDELFGGLKYVMETFFSL